MEESLSMRRARRRLVVAAWAAILSGGGAPAGATELSRALAASQRRDVSLIVELHARWCGVCRVFEREVLVRPEVVSAMRRVEFVQVDADGRLGDELMRRYDIRAVPTFLVIGPSGVVLDIITGIDDIATPGDFIAFLAACNARAHGGGSVAVDHRGGLAHAMAAAIATDRVLPPIADGKQRRSCTARPPGERRRTRRRHHHSPEAPH
jgi:hypothetical protein